MAEQFKIIEARHPRRVDMAIGRSPSFKNVNAALNENKEEKLDFETQLDDLKNTLVIILMTRTASSRY